MSSYTILEAPSNLGLKPTGVERLADALKRAGLPEKLNARQAGRVEPLAFNPSRDPDTHLLNGPGIQIYSRRLADALHPILSRDEFPVVLGGDCSILIGAMLALRQRGRYGLAFVDGHVDFYQPEAERYGEVASMDLAIVSGHGPALLTDIDGLAPLITDECIVALGSRDAEAAAQEGSQDITKVSSIQVWPLNQLRQTGLDQVSYLSVNHLITQAPEGFWIHLDADVLADEHMPAVDYRLPGGLTYAELETLLQTLVRSGKAVGITVTIYNPSLDADGNIGARFADSLSRALTAG